MKFEYDQKKSMSNKTKHGLSLDEAKALWLSSFVEIEANTLGEPRFMVIGKIKKKLHSCIYTVRGDVIRLISARRSSKSEEKIYDEHIKT